MVNIAPVQFAHLQDEQLEDVYSAARALSRDIRAVGRYSLAGLLLQFATSCYAELARRDALTAQRVQLSLIDE